jgi:hypothetical protein
VSLLHEVLVSFFCRANVVQAKKKCVGKKNSNDTKAKINRRGKSTG